MPMKVKRKSRFPSWYTIEIINSIYLGETVLRTFKNFNIDFNCHRFTELSRSLKLKISLAYNNYVSISEQNLIHEVFSDLCRRSRGYSRIPWVLSYDSGMLDMPQNILDAFAEHFSNVYNAPEDEQEIVYVLDNDSIFIDIGRITETDIIQASRK